MNLKMNIFELSYSFIVVFVYLAGVGDVTLSPIMISATHVIMTVRTVLVLLPILGLLVLPCAPFHLVNGLRIVANVTVNNTGDCDVNYCKSISTSPQISF